MSHLLATPQGITLAGVILAKRNADGSFAVKGRQKYIHAQLQAAYGKAVHPQAIRYVERGCELLAKVSDKELEQAAYPFHPNPHARITSGNDFSDLTKGLMMFALTGLNDMENVPEGKARLTKMQASVHHDSLLKSYGLPTWAELAKDDGDDEEDDDEGDEDEGADDEGADDGDSGASAGDGNSHYNPDEPRIPAGQPGGGQWTTAGNGTSTDSGSISVDDTRHDPDDDIDDSARTRFTNELMSSEDTTNDPTDPIDLKRADGTTVTYENGNPIKMPAGVSLSDNIKFGETISDLPSVLIGSPNDGNGDNDLSTRETAMVALFMRNGAMDYQRIYSEDTDGNGNQLINRDYIDFGNYNYGAVGAAAGYQLSQLLNLGGLVNAPNFFNSNVGMVRDPASSTSTTPWLSNPRNDRYITMGYQDYKSGNILGTKK